MFEGGPLTLRYCCKSPELLDWGVKSRSLAADEDVGRVFMAIEHTN
jgi:hypothetical protein